jgi:hypothetical protein
MLDNRDELLEVLGDDPRRIGKVFARHAYGMRRWVDLFAARVPLTPDPQAKQLLAEIVAANARHMNLFRARAIAHGVDPDAYVAPRSTSASRSSTTSTSSSPTRPARWITSASCWTRTRRAPRARTP